MNHRVLLLQETLSLYNVPVYNILAQNVDLTIAYTKKNECYTDVLFKVIKLDFKKICGIYFVKNNFLSLCANFDVVIFLADLHYFSFCILPFIHRKYKVIPWSIGIRASYKKRYEINRKKDLLDQIYGEILNKSDAIIFYMKNPIEFWGNRIDNRKVFIAHNTVEVIHNNDFNIKNKKNRITFIGTLYKEKKIFELIDAFISAKSQIAQDEFLVLDIIGDGDEYNNIKTMIQTNLLNNSIILHGSIFNEEILTKIFSESLLCISPDQAGLSVLKCMGNGVPFVTRSNAITGGERLNIIDGENGLLYKTTEELVSIIIDAYNNPDKFLLMGVNAKNYYLTTATPKHMAQGFIEAINYVLNVK